MDRFFVSSDFFDTLGVSPLLGWLLTPADDVPSGRDRRVAKRHLWTSRFVVSLLYDLAPHDPATLVGAVFMLIAFAAFRMF